MRMVPVHRMNFRRSGDAALENNAAPSARLTRSDLQILVPIWATVFSGMFWISSIRPFTGEIATALDSSVSMVGQTATLAMLAMAVAGLFSGPVADHIGHRRSLVIGLSLLAFAAGVLSMSMHISMLLLAGLIGGIGISMTYGVALGTVATHFQGDERRKALGIAQGFGSSATIVCAPVLSTIAAWSVWRGSHLFMVLIILLAVGLVIKFLPRDSVAPSEPVSPRLVIRAYQPLWSNRSTVRLFIAAGVRGILALGTSVYIAAYYVDRYGMSIREVGLASAIEGLGLVAGSVIGGTYLSRYRLRPLFAAGMFTIGFGWLTVYSVHPPVFIAVGLVIGITFLIGVTMTVLTTMIAEESPCGPATTMVLNISVIGFGASMGAAYGGALIWIGGYALLGIGVVPFSVVSALLVWQPTPIQRLLWPRLSRPSA